MKKRMHVWVLLLVLSISGATAQQIRWGVRAGLNVAGWRGDASQSATGLLDFTNGSATKQARLGFHAGLYAAIPLSTWFTIEPGVQYSQKGAQLRGSFTSQSLSLLNAQATITNQASYLDVPIMAKVYLTDGFFLYGGPQVSFLLANRVNTRASVLGFSVLNRDFDVTSNFRKVDVALTGGLGYRFGNGLNLGVGYDHGLTTLDQRGSIRTYNQVFKASVGFDF